MATNGNENGNGPAAPMHTEAPASATVKIVSPAGFDWMLTARDTTVSGLMDKIAFLEDYLVERGWGAAIGQQGGQASGSKSFTAESLSVSVQEGQAYFKVKGGQFTKYGVNIWPEVMEQSGFNMEEINPMEPPNIAGMVAHYSEWDHEGKTRRKVTELAAA